MREEWALAFGGVAACLALFFGCLSWGERISRMVVKTLGGLVGVLVVVFVLRMGVPGVMEVIAGLGLAATVWFFMARQRKLFQEEKRKLRPAATGGLVVAAGLGLVVVTGLGLTALIWVYYQGQQKSLFQEAKRNAMQSEAISAEEQQKLVEKAVALQNQRKEAEKEKAGPNLETFKSDLSLGQSGSLAGHAPMPVLPDVVSPPSGVPLMGGGPPGMGGGTPGGMGMGAPSAMGGALGGLVAPNNTTFAEELKKALGEELPVPEWKKPKYTPFPQLSGTWIATKAYLNGEEFKSQDKRFKGQDKRQGIAMVCYGESIVIRMGRNFNTPELELGSGQIRLVPGGKDKTFMVRGYSSKPNANGYKQGPIFCTYQIDGEKLSIAFSESEPKLGPAKGQDYYEFKAFSQRFPEELDVTQPISGKKFFCSSVYWVGFPLLKGVWFCESAQFRRETSLNYSKLDPKRFVLTGEGNGLVLYFQATRQRSRSAEPDVKDGFPATTWRFHSWSPGGKGPIEAGKLPQFGTAGIEYLNYEYKGDLLHLTVADSIEGLGRDGKNDVFVFKKVTENWLEEEWKGEKLEKKLEIHAQKDKPMSLPDVSQEKPKDGGKESGKPKEVPAGMVGGVFGGNAVRTFAEELKKALGEDLPIPEGKKPKYTPFPQLSGTWIATKAYLNGEEFKGQDKGQGIAMVCFGESIVIRMGRNFNQPELELGSGQIRLVPGRKDKTFMVRGYAMKPNANGYKQGPIFCTYQIDGEKLSIAFSESEPKLGPLKGQDYYEFKAFSQRFPEELDVTQPISGKKFFCSAVDWVSFPLLKGIWFSESAQFRREASLNYSKLDPKRFVLMGYGDELRIYFEVPNLGTRDGGVEPKGRFPRTIWLFHSWSPGEKGPIQAGKISQGTAGLEFLNYEYKGDLLHLTVADSIGGLGPDGKNDTFLFKKITEDPWLEELKVKNLEEKLKIHAQKSDPINPADMSQEEPKDGGKESGKPKEIPAGKEPGKAADGKEKGK